MLDYDEDLLAESVALGDAAQAVEQASIKSEDVSEQAVMVLGNMEQLKNRFGSRSSFLRTLKRSSE
jgi:hypothetical protein